MNTSKIHLHETILTEKNWRLIERPWYNLGCRKDPHSQADTEEKRSGRSHTPGRRHKEKEDPRDPPWEVNVSALGLDIGNVSPLNWFETWWV